MDRTIEGATRIYRIGWFQRVFSLAFTALGIFFGFAFWGGDISGAREVSFIELVIPPLFVTLGVLFIVRGFKNYIALSQSEIIKQSFFDRQSLPFDKIRGRRRYLDKGTYDSPSIWNLKFEPNDDRYSAIEFEESYYKIDESFLAWFNTLPDLDEFDKTRPKPSNFGLV